MRKRLLSALLALCMALTLLPGAVFAAEGPSGEQGLELTAEPRSAAWGAPAEANASSQALDSSGRVILRDGAYEKWIDRVVLPDYALNFYDILVEASDNDGYRDYLIDDQYFDTTRSNNFKDLKAGDIYYGSGETAIVAAVLEGIPYDSNWTAANAAFDEAKRYIYAACNAFDRDHNEVFWLDYSYYRCSGHFSSPDDGKTVTVWIWFDLRYDPTGINFRANNFNARGIKNAISAMESNVNGILSGLPRDAGRYETLAYFNEWLTTHNEYNTGDLDAGPWDMRSPINALTGKSGLNGPVCESYARAFKVLCDRAGIPCVLVNGDATSSAEGTPGSHMWNYVQMENGKWYAVDSTWNDPTYTEPRGAVSGGETDKWLLLGEHTLVNTGWEFLRSHPVKNKEGGSDLDVSFTNGPVLNPTAYARFTYNVVRNDGNLIVEAERFPERKGDISTYSYAVSSGALPSGLTLDRNTGTVSGTWTGRDIIGDVTVTVTLYENGLAAASHNLTFHGQEPVYTVSVAPVPAEEGAVSVTPASAKAGEQITVAASPKNGYKVDGVTVTDGSGGRVSVTNSGSGVYTFTMPASQVNVSVAFAWDNPYTDVSKGWYYDGVKFMTQNGLMPGAGSDKFRPSTPATRGLMVTIFYLLEGRPAVTSGPAFTDVPAGEYYTDAVAWAAANGIVVGNGDGTFKPNGELNREQLAVFLYSYASYKGYDMSGRADLSGYTDLKSVHSWALNAVSWAVSEGIIAGMTETTLVPRGTATRAQTAVLFMGFCQKVVGMK